MRKKRLPDLPPRDRTGRELMAAADLEENSGSRASVSTDGTNDRRPSVISSSMQKETSLDVAEAEKIFKVLDEREQTLQETSARLKAAEEARDEIHKEWKRATRDLNRLQADRNYKVDDEYLIRVWMDLRFEVKNWAVQFFDGAAKPAKFKTSPPRSELTRLVQDLKPYLRSPILRPHVAQGLVWNILHYWVLEAPTGGRGLLWAGDHHLHLTKMRALLNPGEYTFIMCDDLE